MPILIWLLFWAVMSTPTVAPWNPWFVGLIVATVLTLGYGARLLDR